jgi:hypothetical protein
MTLTLDLPAEVESSLREAAAREGVALDALVLDALRERAARGQNGVKKSAPELSQSEVARLAALRRARGMLRGNGHETDDFMRERHEEGLREMAKDTAQAAGQGA